MYQYVHLTFNRESLQWVYKTLLLGWWPSQKIRVFKGKRSYQPKHVEDMMEIPCIYGYGNPRIRGPVPVLGAHPPTTLRFPTVKPGDPRGKAWFVNYWPLGPLILFPLWWDISRLDTEKWRGMGDDRQGCTPIPKWGPLWEIQKKRPISCGYLWVVIPKSS